MVLYGKVMGKLVVSALNEESLLCYNARAYN